MTWQVFHTTTNPTGQELDDNLGALTRMGVYPCVVTGSANAILLALADTAAPPIAAYQNYQEFAFIAGSTSTSTVTIKVGALAALPAYKDTNAGSVALASSEIVQNCAYVALYDLALNAGGGGFHVRPGAMTTNSPINPSTLQVGVSTGGTVTGSTITRVLTGAYTVAFTVVPANLTQDQVVTLTGATLGDFVQVGLTAAPTAGLMFNGRVPAAGSITLRAANVTASSIAAFTLSGVHLGVIGATP